MLDVTLLDNPNLVPDTQYLTIIGELAQQIKQNGSKRARATSINKLVLIIEELAQFMNDIAFNSKYHSKNPLVRGFSLNQPLLNEMYQNRDISVHHNVVHDLLEHCMVRDASYNNNPDLGPVYCKTTVGFTPHFNYILNNINKLNNKDSIAFKLQAIQQDGYQLVINESLGGGDSIVINGTTYQATGHVDSPKLAIIGLIGTKELERALKRVTSLIQQAKTLKSTVIKTAKLARLNKNKLWIETCLYNNGMYIDLYRLTECGRQYSLGISLQNMNKEIRAKVLKKHQALDQKGSHLKIVADMAATHEINMPLLNQYLNMPSHEISQIIGEAKMRKTTFKKTVLAVLNGYNGPKTLRHQFLHNLALELQKVKKTLNWTSKDLFSAERARTNNKIKEVGLQNVLSLEFDGFSLYQSSQPLSDSNWKINQY